MDDPLVRRSRSAHPRRRALSAAKYDAGSASKGGYASRLRSRVLATVSTSLSPADEEYLQQVRSREGHAAEYRELRAAGGWGRPSRRRRLPPYSAHTGGSQPRSLPHAMGRGVSARAAPTGGDRGWHEREVVGAGPTLELPSTSRQLSPMPSLSCTGEDSALVAGGGHVEEDGAASRPVRRSPRPRTAHPAPSSRWTPHGGRSLAYGPGDLRPRACDDSALSAGGAGLLSEGEGEGGPSPLPSAGPDAVRRRAHAEALSHELADAALRARVALEDVDGGRPGTADLTGASVQHTRGWSDGGAQGPRAATAGARGRVQRAGDGTECLDAATDAVVEEICAAVAQPCPEHAALLRRVWREHVVPSRRDAAALARALLEARPARARRGETDRACDRVLARSGEQPLHSWQSFSARMLDKSPTPSTPSSSTASPVPAAGTPASAARFRPRTLRSALISPPRSATASRPASLAASGAQSGGRATQQAPHASHPPSRARQALPVAVGQHARLLLLSILRLRHVMFGEVTRWAREEPWPLNVASGESDAQGGARTAASDAARLWEHVSAAGLRVAGPGSGTEPAPAAGAHRGSLRSVFAHTALLAQEGELWRRSHGGAERDHRGSVAPEVAFRPSPSAEAAQRALGHSRVTLNPRRAAELQLSDTARVRRAQAVARGWLARRAALRIRFARLTQLDPRALWREATEAQSWAAARGASTPSSSAPSVAERGTAPDGRSTAMAQESPGPAAGGGGREALVWQLLWECQRLARDLAARWWRSHAEAERRRAAWADARRRTLIGPLLDAVSALSDRAHELAWRATQSRGHARQRSSPPASESAATTTTEALNRAAAAQAALASALEAVPDPDAAVSCAVQTVPVQWGPRPSPSAHWPIPRTAPPSSPGEETGSPAVGEQSPQPQRGAGTRETSRGGRARPSGRQQPASDTSPREGGGRAGGHGESELGETRISRVRSRRLQEEEEEEDLESILEPSVYDAGPESGDQSGASAERGGQPSELGRHRRGTLQRQPSAVIRERRRVRPGFGDSAMLLSAARRKLFTRAAFRRGCGAVLPHHMLPLFRKLKPSYQAREIPPSTLLPLLEHAYASKLEQDGVADRALAPRRTFPEFLFDQFTRKYGLRALAEARLVDVASSVKRLWPQQSLPPDTVPLFALLMGLLPPTAASAAPPRPPADATAAFRRAVALDEAAAPQGRDAGGGGVKESKRSRPQPLGGPCRPPVSAGALAFLLRQRAAAEDVCEFELSLLRRRAQEEEAGGAVAAASPTSPTPSSSAGAADTRGGAAEGHVHGVGMQGLLMSESKAMRLVRVSPSL